MNKRQKHVQQRFLDNEEAVIDELEKTYNKALKDINDKIAQLMARGDADMQHVIYQVEYQKALKKQISGILDAMQAEEFTTIADYLQKCYQDGFIGALYDIHGQGIPIIFPIDQEAVVQAVQLDSQISNGLYSGIGEDVGELKKNIAAEVSRGISTNASYAQIAQQIKSHMIGAYTAKTGGALYRAQLIARTEGHRVQVQSAWNACHAAKEKGADLVKQWDAALDRRTRKSHTKVDGEIRELDEPFSNGLMYPGDPDGGAAEVCNCRCAMLQRARWALDEDELETLKKRAEYFGLDKTQNFEDFKQKYLKAAEEIQQEEAINTANYSCELAKSFGKSYYDALHERVVNAANQKAAAVWKKYEADIKVGDAKYKGHPHCSGHSIYVNGANDAKGNSFEAPYQVTFHESGHAIDSLARKTVTENGNWFARHYSSAYKDGLFPQTIKDEVAELVKARDKELKAAFKEHAGDVEWFRANGFISDWEYQMYQKGTYTADRIIPTKYRKAYAYSSVQKEITANNSMLAYGDLSDIMEGATGAKIQCGIGHGASYWKDRTYSGLADGLATEAFAEMLDSTFTNPESLDLIQKYLPKSYALFLEMIENLL